MTRVLVTGATGFVGRALVEALVDSGFAVTAAVRDTATAPRWPDAVRVAAIGEIGGRTHWDAALDGVERVAHLAGIAHHPIADDAATAVRYTAVNVEGTAALADAAARAGVARLLFLSSVKVNGERTSLRPFTETDVPAPEDVYGRSKWQAEQALATIARAGGLPVTIIRSPLVYGPGVRGNFASLLRLCDTPLPLPFGAIDNRRSLIARANLVSAVIAALNHPAAAGETFLVRDGEDLSTATLVRHLRRALGRPPRLVPVPAVLLAGATRLLGRGAMTDRLLGSLAVDDGKIREKLQWQPPMRCDSALAEAATALHAMTSGT
jgi:UDP-glucose 4-epimerase